MSATPDPTWLLSLADPRARDPLAAGGKAARLADLVQRGLPVPDGFVLATSAPLEDPAALRAGLRAALEALGDVPLAVRSSGVAEDLGDASFAGLYETVLDVRGIDAVVDAVARCRASADAERVRAYRQSLGVAAAPLAILIQRFVPARAAGVAFTADPVTGDRDVVRVSAVAGVGEALVSGQADAEEWEVRDAPSRRRGPVNVLTDDEVMEVVALAREVDAVEPLDIEWAILGQGAEARLHLLQARPMTSLPEPVRWESPTGQAFVRNFRLGEWIGAPVSPLFQTWMLSDLDERMHRHFYGLTGFAPPRPLQVVVNGWYFYGGMNYDMSPGALVRALPRMLAALLGARRAQVLATIPPLAHLGFDSELARWRTQLLPSLRATVARVEAQLDRATPEELLRLVQQVVSATADQYVSIIGVSGYAAKAEARLLVFWRKHLAHHEGSMLEVVAGAGVQPAPHDVEGLDPIFPTLGERGRLPPGPSEEVRSALLRRRDDAEARALDALPQKLRPRLAALVQEARRAHVARIEQTGCFTLGWPVMRQALLRLGDGLVTRRLLDARDDVFFLTREELQAAVDGRSERAPVAARRTTWQRQRRLDPPLVIGTMTGFMKSSFEPFLALMHHEEHEAADALVGMPGSPGRVTGPARVVLDVDELDRLHPGEILVAPVTTPAWTLAFGRALAIVTDTGSIASHASVVAREHGIPAVVATGHGTHRIVDGQRITVDGGRGVVRLDGGG